LKVLIVGGAGHIGSHITREIREYKKDWEIIIGDINYDAASELAEEIGGNTSALKVDAQDIDDMASKFRGLDIVIGAVGPFYRYGVPMLKAAIKGKVSYFDIDDDYDATKDSLDLCDEAASNDVLAIVGLGFTPGVTNMIVKLVSEELEKVDTVRTAWVWTGIDPTEGPGIVAHYFHASTGEVPTYRDGRLVYVPALSEPEEILFHKLGSFTVSHVGHPEPITIPRYIEGVRDVSNKGTIWPKYLADAARLFSELGLTSMNEVQIRGMKVPAREIAVRLVMSLPNIAPPETLERIFEEAHEKYGEYSLFGAGLNINVKGILNGELTVYEYGVVTESAARATAYPVVAGIKQYEEGKIDGKGVFAPEGALDAKSFIKDVSKAMEIVYKKSRLGIIRE
jgi:saccharopine dehydrogenase-like NADP-dependent oxidoreductase